MGFSPLRIEPVGAYSAAPAGHTDIVSRRPDRAPVATLAGSRSEEGRLRGRPGWLIAARDRAMQGRFGRFSREARPGIDGSLEKFGAEIAVLQRTRPEENQAIPAG